MLDSQGTGIQFSAGARNFSFLRNVQTSSEAHPSSCSVELGGSFLGIEAAGGMMPTAKLHLVPRLKMFDTVLHSPKFHCVVFN
jgi:hypothetical protein